MLMDRHGAIALAATCRRWPAKKLASGERRRLLIQLAGRLSFQDTIEVDAEFTLQLMEQAVAAGCRDG
jgi:hypothetical protein